MSEIMQPFRIPETDDNTIIFSYNTFKGRFDLTSYNPEMTDYKLNTEDLQKFFQRLERYLKPWKSSVRIFSLFVCGFCLFSIGGSLSIPLIYVLCEDINVILYIMIPLIVGLSFRILWMSFQPARDIQTRLQEAKLKAQILINSKEAYFRSKGLKWNIPPHFPEWIELCKVYPAQITELSSQGVQLTEIS